MGGLNGRPWVGVDEDGAFGVARGPVGMLDGPLGVDGDGDGPPMCLDGAWFQAPLPPRVGYAAPRPVGTYPLGPDGTLDGLVTSERDGPPGVGGCLDP